MDISKYGFQIEIQYSPAIFMAHSAFYENKKTPEYCVSSTDRWLNEETKSNSEILFTHLLFILIK
jgi:hypothetical protein